MTSITTITRILGGVARVAALRTRGVSESRIRAAVVRGELLRIRKGWVRLVDASPDLVRAVELGGRIACVSAARHHDLWAPEGTDFHLARPKHAGRTYGDLGDAIEHWQSTPWRLGAPIVEPVPALVRQVLLCSHREDALAIIDSALNKNVLSMAQLARIVDALPPRFASVLDEVDPKSQSGLETLCRVRLSILGVRIRSQMMIDGVGRLDLVIGDRVVIETDGRAWHDGPDAFHRDRTRDLALLGRGYIVIRLSYQQVLHEWQLVEPVVRAIIGRREHLWSAAHRRDGLGA